MEAAVNKKPVRKPKASFSQKAFKPFKPVNNAPIMTANPIIAQFTGRIRRIHALTFSINIQALYKLHNDLIKEGYKIHV
jgi:hypothetical protein